jgi:hypothetical protein
MQSWHEGAEAIIEIMIARISKEYPSAKTMTMEAAIELFGELANHARIGLKYVQSAKFEEKVRKQGSPKGSK